MPSPLSSGLNSSPVQAAAWLNIVAKLGGTALSFLLYLALARLMTPGAFADVVVMIAWVSFGATLACFSFPLALVRFVPENLSRGRADLARGAVQFSIALTEGVAIAIAAATALAILLGVVELPRDMPRSALAAAALVVPSVLLLLLAGILTALKRAAASEILVNVMRPLLVLLGLAGLWMLRPAPLTAPWVMAVYLAASMIMVVVCLCYCVAILPRELARAKPTYAIREWTSVAAGFMVIAVLAALYERVDLMVMGLTAPPAEIAAYAVAARFAQTVVVAVNAASAVMAPHLVERLPDLQAGRRHEVQRLVRDTARTSLWVSVIALAAFAALAPLFLKLFGPHYESAYRPLVILAVGQAICTLFGPAAGIATLAGAPRIAILGLLCGTLANVALNLMLVPRFGATGAAFATATGMVCLSAVAWLLTRHRFHLDTSVFHVRPL